MIKLLIVDDDSFIRMGLQHMLPWEELGVTAIRLASGGWEAMDIIREWHPNLLITDIQMPQGDGLALIEQVRKEAFPLKIMVLSGYNDFSYVRQAMKYQVEDYLLKPINEEEFLEVVKTCISQLERSRIIEQTERETHDLLHNNVFIRWVENRIDEKQLAEKMQFLELASLLQHSWFRCGIIEWRDAREGPISSGEEQFRPFSILNVVSEALLEYHLGHAFLDQEQRVVCIFSAKNQPKLDLLTWMSELARRAALLLKVPWLSVMGPEVGELSQVHHSYKHALSLLDYAGLAEDSIVCIDDAWVSRYTSAMTFPSSREKDALIHALLSANREAWSAELEKDMRWALLQTDPLWAAKTVGGEWIVLLRQTVKQVKGSTDLLAFVAPDIMSKLFMVSSIYEVRQKVYELLDRLDVFIKTRANQPGPAIVTRVTDFIQSNLNSELSLKTIAQHFHINNVYLGQLFKQETGEFFSDYLNRLRMEQAQRLLHETTLKATEIATRVGFAEPNYFFRKFKQFSGLSPTEYRNLTRDL
ncbi:MAG: response regulator [Gorillibacterium sp.]|nr:response regulator [Gorillibacterium sp.]